MSEADAVAWLRKQIEGDLAQARLAIGAENINAQWMETSTGVLHTGPGTETDIWDGTWPMGDGRLTRFIATHDPLDVVADCEAKLSILDEHYILTKTDRSEAYEEYSVVPRGIPGGAGDTGMGCVCCHYQGSGGVAGYGVCRTVKALASAYRHREGYAGHWPAPGEGSEQDQ